MSLEDNTVLLEQARQIAEEYTGTPIEQAILDNIERNDLDTVARLVKEVEDEWLAEATMKEFSDVI